MTSPVWMPAPFAGPSSTPMTSALPSPSIRPCGPETRTGLERDTEQSAAAHVDTVDFSPLRICLITDSALSIRMAKLMPGGFAEAETVAGGGGHAHHGRRS